MKKRANATTQGSSSWRNRSGAGESPPPGWLPERRREAVLKLVNAIEVLPSTMTVPFRIMQLRQTATAGAREFAEVLSTDPSLTARILSLANSAWFSPTQKVVRVSDAVTRIGMANLLPLVFAGSLAAVYNTMAIPAEQLDLMWRSALLKAVAAREYARVREPERVEESFLAGLLQDIGLMVMYAADPGVWGELASSLDLPDAERAAREQALFGADHAAVGALLARKMQLPELYVATTVSHHAVRAVEHVTGHGAIIECVRFAGALPHQIDNWKRPGAARLTPFMQGLTGGKDDGVRVTAMLEGIQREYEWLLGAVGHGAAASISFREFIQGTTRDIMRCLELAVGEATLLATTFEEREATLKSQISALSRETDSDSLTGLLNRRGFERMLLAKVAEAAVARAELVIGFIDLDGFKSINDACGHVAGDAALCAATDAMRSTLGGGTPIARLGGDEFAFVAVGHECRQADLAVQNMLERLRSMRFRAGSGRTLAMSASIGLLLAGVPDASTSMERLMQEADRLMYQAKRAGKSRCIAGRLEPNAAQHPHGECRTNG